MKILAFFLFVLFVLSSCKQNSKKKNIALSNDIGLANLPKPINKVTTDSFSRFTSTIFCSEKYLIIYGGYVFTFCEDSVKKVLNSEISTSLKITTFDSAILLCRKIPFSLTNMKTKKPVKAIHYLEENSSGSGSKNLCLEHFVEKNSSRQCLMQSWIN